MSSVSASYPPASPAPPHFPNALPTAPRIELRPSPSAPISAATSASPQPSAITTSRTTPEPPAEDEDELQDDDDMMEPSNPARDPVATKGGSNDGALGRMYPSVLRAASQPFVPAASGPGPGPGPSTSHAASPRNGVYSNAGQKSRKSSCQMCHHRKIKCDQLRPSCSSCVRKGQVCRYAEEADPAAQPSRATQQSSRAMSVTIVNASDPSIKYTMPVPVATPSLKVGYGQTNHPEWKVAESTSDKGSAEKKKVAERRERIVKGFDSDSDDDVDRGSKNGEGSTGGGSAGRLGREKSTDLDGELSALAGDAKPDEVDELEDEGDKLSAGSVDTNGDVKKRGTSIDDDLSGEVSDARNSTADTSQLLELASAPPKKKKKPVAPLPSSVSLQTLPRPPAKSAHNRGSGGRYSLPSSGLPPTPATGILSYNRVEAVRFDPYSTPLLALSQSLPSQEMQNILLGTFLNDPFIVEGVSLLHPQYLDDLKGLLERRTSRFAPGDATTLANTFAFLAVALRILPEETSKLLLASHGYGNVTSQLPRSLYKVIASQPASANDPTPLYQRYLDLALVSAQIAEQADPPSVMLVMFKLILYRYCMLGHRRDKIVLAGMWLAQAVKVAQALGMGKEWEGLTQGERELRRRVMWSLYVADRHHSFETSFPYTILDAHQGIHLPSPMSETDLYQLRPDIRELPAHATEVAPTACTALFIHTHLARRITPILDSFATISAANTPHDLVLRFDASLDAFQDALPPYFRLFPLTETRFDSTHTYLPAHRVRLHATLLAYRSGVHRTHLSTYLLPVTPTGIRQVIAQVCLSSLRVQRSAKLLDGKVAFRLFNPVTIFDNAATLALIMYVERALGVAASISDKSAGVIRPAAMMAPELMAMRSGVAEAAELLDNVSAGEGQTFSRSAVAVIRGIMAKVDAPIKAPSVVSTVQDGIPMRTATPEPPDHADQDGQEKKPASTHTSPISIDKLTESNPPSPAKPVAGEAGVDSYAQAIIQWLEGIKKAGLSLDVLLREPDWANGWEKVVAGMVL
ncbi:hypothetical protein IAU60_000988 [Kwoniella sp. DSM 27419]